MKEPTVLGIESTAHTFGVAITKGNKILSNIRNSYTTKQGGIIPIDAANHHLKIYKSVIEQALKEAHKKITDIN